MGQATVGAYVSWPSRPATDGGSPLPASGPQTSSHQVATTVHVRYGVGGHHSQTQLASRLSFSSDAEADSSRTENAWMGRGFGASPGTAKRQSSSSNATSVRVSSSDRRATSDSWFAFLPAATPECERLVSIVSAGETAREG